MEFYKALALTVLSGVVSPLAVYYIKALFPCNRAKRERNGEDSRNAD